METHLTQRTENGEVLLRCSCYLIARCRIIMGKQNILHFIASFYWEILLILWHLLISYMT